MKKQKLQNTILTAVIVSEFSHVFCCVLPTIFSIMALLSGLGMVGVMPGWLEDMHAAMHNWEMPMIIISGVVIALGWGLHYYSEKIDCHDTGCGHGPCDKKKKTAHRILKFATLLFLINVTIYGVFHRAMDANISAEHSEHAHEH